MANEDNKPPIMFPWLNSPYVRRLEAWLWRHPKSTFALTAVSVGLISSPAWFSDFWSLFSNEAPVPKIINWISGLPTIDLSWYWLPVGLGSVMFVVITSLLWRGRKRLEAEVASARSKPESSCPPESQQCQYAPVHHIADHQAKNIRDFVFVSKVGVWEDKLTDPIPTIKWGFFIENKSLFPINLIDVRNNVFFETTELAERRFVDHNEVEQLGYWRSGSYIFRQRLSPIEAQHIRSMPAGKFRFNRLIIKVGNPASSPVIEPQELTLGDDLETTLNALAYKETEGMKTLKDEIVRLKYQVEEREAQVQKPALHFEIDAKATQVHTSGGGAVSRTVQANVQLRCIKNGDSKLAIRQISAALFSTSDKGEEEVARNGAVVVYSHPDMKIVETRDGWTIEEPLTPYRWYMFFLDIENKILSQLTPRNSFFRITMDAIGQEPQHIDFFVNSWNDVMSSNSSITLRDTD